MLNPVPSDQNHGNGNFLTKHLGRVFPENAGFESQRYLIKWLFLSSLIGVVAGISAIVFTWAIDFVTHAGLGEVVGYIPPSPVGEGQTRIRSFGNPWLLPLVTAIGGLLSGIIVFKFAPEAEGHGTDAAIDAIHHKRARIRGRIPPIKLIASAITIGSGGSAGREGPTAQMSAGFGSILANWLHLNLNDRRIAACVGIGAGIGAIFRAPLGGAVMAAEILYIHDLEVEALIPTLMASIIGYSIYGAFYGYVPIFGNLSRLVFDHPFQLIHYGILGVLCGLVGLLYSFSFYRTTHLFEKIHCPIWIKPAIGGFIVGLLALLVPGALHTGYGWVQLTLGNGIFKIPFWMLLILPFAKILSTSLSIGSGGSGGIFGPGMVIGGILGAAFWRIVNGWLPQTPSDPSTFVIIGMMALFGGIAHAPLAVMLMVAEMTGNLSLLAPAMVAVAISTALVGDHTIYRNQLRTRADSPAHKIRLSFPLLSSLLIRDAMSNVNGTRLSAETSISDARATLQTSEDMVVVINGQNEILGTLTSSDLEKIAEQEQLRSALRKEWFFLEPEQSLDDALHKLSARGLDSATVMYKGNAIGRVTIKQIMQSYKLNLEHSVRRTTKLDSNSVMFQVQIKDSMPLAGCKLREAGLPADTLIVSITREGQTLFPNADTQLFSGDSVLIMASKESEEALKTFVTQ